METASSLACCKVLYQWSKGSTLSCGADWPAMCHAAWDQFGWGSLQSLTLENNLLEGRHGLVLMQRILCHLHSEATTSTAKFDSSRKAGGHRQHCVQPKADLLLCLCSLPGNWGSSHLSSVTSLDLSGNALTGSLPDGKPQPVNQSHASVEHLCMPLPGRLSYAPDILQKARTRPWSIFNHLSHSARQIVNSVHLLYSC